MDATEFNQDLLQFLDAGRTPFHAVSAMAQRLEASGFTHLAERDNWDLKPGARHYVVRNGSSIVAFVLGESSLQDAGLRLIGAHTDSPCLRVKPQPELRQKNYWQLGVEVYGGALLAPWFDRDLSVAGRVSYLAGGELQSRLIDFQRPLAVIPSLAIHLDREVNNSRSINAQRELPPLLMQCAEDEPGDWRALLRAQLQTQYAGLAVDEVLDFELNFYDTQPAALVGLRGDFIASARLDNLLSCYAGMRALQQASGAATAVLVCNDHEEVGSMSAVGAQGPMLRAVLERLCGGAAALTQVLERSLLISCDNAHALHPNFVDRHDGNHGPLMNGGPVIKINANQRYASNSETAALFRQLCRSAEVPVQSFVVRTDMACGSTIGPLTAGELGVPTVDVGVPQLAMHSVREMAGARDPAWLAAVLTHFVRRERLWSEGA